MLLVWNKGENRGPILSNKADSVRGLYKQRCAEPKRFTIATFYGR